MLLVLGLALGFGAHQLLSLRRERRRREKDGPGEES